MTRTVDRKLTVWMAGYYDDFMGARTVPDDLNTPTATYYNYKSHQGNPINGWANLNPRYAYAMVERAQLANNALTTEEGGKFNSGLNEWLGYDQNRRSGGNKYEGLAIPQYPDSLTNANRQRYNAATTTDSHEGYLRFTYAHDTSCTYYAATGSTDSTFGRDTMNYPAKNNSGALDNSAGLPTTASTPTTMVRTHTAGTYAGIKTHTSTTGVSGYLYPIESPSGQPFLVQEIYHNSSTYKPMLAYNGTLNSKGDNDIFTIRIAPLELATTTTPYLKLRVGCEGTAWTSTSSGDTSYSAAAVELEIAPADFIQNTVTTVTTGNLGAYVQPSMSDVWIDYDFVFDYTNGTYDLYKNGTKIVTAGAIGNKADGNQFEAADMYGWELQAKGAQKKIAVLIDRVGMIRPLNDHPSGVDMPPAVKMSYQSGSNSVSTLNIDVIDDDQQLTLMPMFNQNSYANWSLLLFRNACDRPIWRGSVTGMNYKLDATNRTPTISIQASDYFSNLDRQLPTWEMGTSDEGTQTSQIAYNRSESQRKLDVYYMGATRNQRANATLGFNEVVDGSGTFTKHLDSRMRNRTSHAIQVYNDEDTIGPNDAYDDWDDAITAGHATSDAQHRSLHSRWMQDLPKSAWFNYMFARIKPTDHSMQLASNFTVGDTSMVVQGIHEVFDTSSIFGLEFRATDGFVDSGIATGASVASSANILKLETKYVAKYFRTSQGSTLIPVTNPEGGYYYFVAHIPKTGIANAYAENFRLKSTRFPNLNGRYCAVNVTSSTVSGIACWKFELGTKEQRSLANGTTTYTARVRFKEYVAPSVRTSARTTESSIVTGAFSRKTLSQRRIGFSFYDDVMGQTGIPDGGIAVNGTKKQTIAGVYPGVMQYGNTTITLPATNFFQQNHLTGTLADRLVHIRELDNDFKHVWILWADARNDGTANADAGYRKQEYGLLAPYAGNYELSLSYADENISNSQERQIFTDLAIGEDVNFWEMGNTDPITGNAWSAVSGGSNSESNSKYHNWEDKAGAFVIVDGSRFFNLNTQSNGGQAGQTSGGRKEIGDYLVETEGFPVLIDNYWDRASTSPYNLDESASWNANYKSLHSKNSGLLTDIQVGDGIVYLDDPSIVAVTTGIGTGTAGVVGQIISNEKKKIWHLNVVSDELQSFTDYAHASNNGFFAQVNSDFTSTGEVTATGQMMIKVQNILPYDDMRYFATLRTGQTIEIEARTAAPPTMSSGASFDGEYTIIKHGTISSSSPIAGTYSYFVINLEDSTDAVTTAGAINIKIPNGFRVEALSFLGNPNEFGGASGEWDGSGYGGANSAETLMQAKGRVFSEVTIDTTQSDAQNTYPDARVHFGLANIFPMRLLMEINGFVKNKGSLTFFDHDKFRVSWMDCLTETWLKQTKLYGMWDINTIPVSENMSTNPQSASLPGQAGDFKTMTESSGTVTAETYASNHHLVIGQQITIKSSAKLNVANSEVTVTITATPAIDSIQFAFSGFNASGSTLGSYRAVNRLDSYGSINDCRNTTIANIFSTTEASSGIGEDYSVRSSFSWLMGRDSMPSYRPTYGSGFVFNSNNLRTSSLSTQSSDQITNVRVFYGGSSTFVDYPTVSLDSSPRWEIINMPDITSQSEALAVAKAEYEKLKSAPLSITAEVTRFSDAHNFYGDKGVMLDDARYGYIADVSRTVTESTHSATLGYAWTGLHGGNLFPGRVNALDGSETGADTPNASAGTDTYDDYYGFYGANSISYAVQVVHIPKGMPKTANRSPASNNTLGDGKLRVFVDLADQGAHAQESTQRFVVYLADYDFNVSFGVAPNGAIFTPTLATDGSTSCEIDGNGFYEIAIPISYWPDQTGSEMITISVNYDYLLALRRNRCGSSNLGYSSGDITGVTTWGTTNDDSIFPLGCRKFGKGGTTYNLENAYWTRLAEWFAPRLHITDDINFIPSTTVSYTDTNFAMTNEPLVVKRIGWSIDGRNVEKVTFTLERDVSRAAKDFASYIIPTTSKGGVSRRQPGTHTSAGSQKSSQAYTKQSNSPSDGAWANQVGFGDTQPGLVLGDSLVPINRTSSFIPDQTTQSENRSVLAGSNQLSNGINNRLKGVMNFNNDSVTGGAFGVLGQTKPSAKPRDTAGLDGLDSHIAPSSGDAIMSSDGMVFPGAVDNSSPHSKFTINSRVPDRVTSKEVSVTARATMKATTGDSILYVTVECPNTGAFDERTVTLTSGDDKNVILFSGSLDGAEVGGNTLIVTLERTAGTDGDTAQYGSVVLNNIQVSSDKSSVAGSSQSGSLSY